MSRFSRFSILRGLLLSQLALGLGVIATVSPAIQWVNCTEHVPLPLQGTDTLPDPLPTTLHCGLLAVPMDYSKPISGQNNITIGFAMHRPPNPVGLLNLCALRHILPRRVISTDDYPLATLEDQTQKWHPLRGTSL